MSDYKEPTIEVERQAVWETMYDVGKADMAIHHILSNHDMSTEAREKLQAVQKELHGVWETLKKGGAKEVADCVAETFYCEYHDI